MGFMPPQDSLSAFICVQGGYMRPYTVPVCLVVLSALAAADINAPILNPGFEDYGLKDTFEAWPTNWSMLGNHTDVFEFVADTTTSQSGAASGRVKVIAEGTAGYCCHVDQRLPDNFTAAMHDHTMRLDAWVKSSRDDLQSNLQVVVQLAHVEDGWQQLGWKSVAAGTSTEWHQVSNEFTISPSVNRTVVTLYVKPLQEVGVTLWVDDISVTILETGAVYKLEGRTPNLSSVSGPVKIFTPDGRVIGTVVGGSLPEALAPGLHMLRHGRSASTPMVLPQ